MTEEADSDPTSLFKLVCKFFKFSFGKNKDKLF